MATTTTATTKSEYLSDVLVTSSGEGVKSSVTTAAPVCDNSVAKEDHMILF